MTIGVLGKYLQCIPPEVTYCINEFLVLKNTRNNLNLKLSQ